MRVVALALALTFATAAQAGEPASAPAPAPGTAPAPAKSVAKPPAASPAKPSPSAEPPLSRAQVMAVTKAISALKTSEERNLASGWSNAKKVAEVICRPAALPALKRQVPGADKVFLGTDDPTTLTLVSVRSLTGVGQVRSGSSWRDFNFTCALIPSSGKVAGFTAVLKPAA